MVVVKKKDAIGAVIGGRLSFHEMRMRQIS